MDTATDTTADPSLLQSNSDADPGSPFSQQLVTITKAGHIDLIHRANSWEGLHAQLKLKCARLEEEVQPKSALIKDLNNRVFGTIRVYFVLDQSRSASVPGIHFAGLKEGRVILVCGRYSAYKKLARLTDAILSAFCWAHVRRDHLDAGRSYKALEPWALDWKERIGELYHRNHLRLEHWDRERPLDQQSFRVLLTPLTCIHAGKARPLTSTIKPCRRPCRGCMKKPPTRLSPATPDTS